MAGQPPEGRTTVSAPTSQNDYEFGMGSGRSVEPEEPSTDYDYGLGSGRTTSVQDHTSHKHDSTIGKIEEEAGKLLHSKQLEESGEEKRREAGAFKHGSKH